MCPPGGKGFDGGKGKGPKLTWKAMVQKLANQGIETYLYHSIQKDEVYVKVRVPLAVLEKRADDKWGSEEAYQAYKKETYAFFLLPTQRTEASAAPLM